MQFEEKCSSCQIDFDDELGIPFVLPCEHSICQTCLTSDFRRQNQNKCSICQKVSNVHPNKLVKNEQIIKKIQQRTQKQQQIAILLESLSFYKHNLKQIMQKIIQSQSSIIFEVISLINKSLFAQKKQNFMDIFSKVHEINNLIEVLKQYKENKSLTLIDKFEEQQYSQLEEDIKELQNKGEQQIQNYEKQKEMILYLINQLFQLSAFQEVEEFKQIVNKIFQTHEYKLQLIKNQKKQEKIIKFQENNSNFIHYF